MPEQLIPLSEISLVLQNEINALAREINEAKERVKRAISNKDESVINHNNELIIQRHRDINYLIGFGKKFSIHLVFQEI